MQLWISTGKAGELLGVHSQTIHGYCKRGLLTHRRLPSGRYLVHIDSLKPYLEPAQPALKQGPTAEEIWGDA